MVNLRNVVHVKPQYITYIWNMKRSGYDLRAFWGGKMSGIVIVIESNKLDDL